MDDNHQDVVLDILFSIANQVPIALEPYLCLFEKSNYYDCYKVSKILSTIGRSLKSKSEYCTNLLIKRLDNTDKTLHVLKEIYAIAVVHPTVLGNKVFFFKFNRHSFHFIFYRHMLSFAMSQM